MLATKLNPFFDHKGKGRPCNRIQTGSLDILFLSNTKWGCHCCKMIVLPPNIQGPFSSTSCISSSVLNLKSIKPFVVVMTFSSPLFFQALDAIVFTAWYGILKPGKNPTMHLFHFPVVSRRISSGITSLVPANCLGIPSKENLVLVFVTLTLSA
jgi:hypothetical protein